MQILRLDTDHLPTVLDFRYAMMSECGGSHLLADDWREVTAEIYRTMYAKGTGAHFGALDEGRVVATAGCLIKDEFPAPALKDRRLGWIMDVYVQPHYRRRGLSETLTKQCMDWLREQGITWIKLSASQQARDYKLYDKLGFTRTSEMMIRFAAPSASVPVPARPGTCSG